MATETERETQTLHVTLGIAVRPRFCTCCQPPRRTGTWDAGVVEGPKSMIGYHCWQATPEAARTCVESALRAVFPTVHFTFNEAHPPPATED